MNRTEVAQSRSVGRGYMLIMLAGCMWGTTGVFSRVMYTYLGGTSSTAAFYRMLGAVLLMGIYVALRNPKDLRLDKGTVKLAAFQGLTTGCLFSLAYISAIGYLGMSTAAILLYTSPVYVIIISRIMFGEEIGPNKIIAVMINLLGCALTVTGGSFQLKGLSIVGILLGLGAGLCYSMLPICGRLAAGRIKPETITFYSMVFGLIFLLIFAQPWKNQSLHLADWRLILWSLLCGLVTTALPFTLYTYGMSIISEPSKGPVLASLENVSASVLGVILFGEFMNGWKVGGILLVFFSIIVVNRKETGK